MLLAISLGLYPLSSQTTALAQPSLAEDIINSVEQETDSSSADGNVLDNNNEFGDDVPVIDQENTAEQDAVNVGAQDVDQDATQEDLNFQFGFSQQTGDFDIECPTGFDFNPETDECEQLQAQPTT
jgi:hypothetical protein